MNIHQIPNKNDLIIVENEKNTWTKESSNFDRKSGCTLDELEACLNDVIES